MNSFATLKMGVALAEFINIMFTVSVVVFHRQDKGLINEDPI